MTASVQGVLGPPRDRFGLVVAVSAVLHVAVLAAALVLRPAPIIDLEQKPIVARLVRLGEKRPENLLPRKEPDAAGRPEAPPTAAPAPPAPAPAPKAAPAARAPPPPKPRTAPPAAGRPDAFAAALSRIRREKVLTPDTSGSPDGDPSGDASSGEAGDRYLSLVQRALRETYRLPSTISERDQVGLRATVVLYVEPDGRISRWAFESRSGSQAFDDALDRAIRQARLPPPPAELRERYRTVGLGVRFTM